MKPVEEEEYNKNGKFARISIEGKDKKVNSCGLTPGGKLSMKINKDRSRSKGKKISGVGVSMKYGDAKKGFKQGRVSSSSLSISSDESVRIREIRKKVGFVWKDKEESDMNKNS